MPDEWDDYLGTAVKQASKPDAWDRFLGESVTPEAVRQFRVDQIAPKMEQVDQWAMKKIGDAPVNIMGWNINLGKEIGSKTLGGVGYSVQDILEKAVPFTEFQGRVDEERYGAAKKAYQDYLEGKGPEPTDTQLGQMREYELRQQRESARSQRSKLAGLPLSAVKVVGEMAAAGPLIRGVAAPLVSRIGATAATAVGTAAATPAMPDFWLKESQQNANEKGGKWYDLKNVSVPLARAAATNVILNQIGKFANSKAVANTASTALGRIAAKAAVAGAAMPVEAAGAELLMSGVQDALESAGFNEYLDPREKRYSTFRDALAGKWGDVGTKLASDALLGAGFSFLHPSERAPKERKQTPVESLGNAIESLKTSGVPEPQALTAIHDAVEPVIQASDRLTKKEIQEKFIDPMPDGPLKDYAQAVIDSRPDGWRAEMELGQKRLYMPPSPPEAIKRDLPAPTIGPAKNPNRPTNAPPPKPAEPPRPAGMRDNPALEDFFGSNEPPLAPKSAPKDIRDNKSLDDVFADLPVSKPKAEEGPAPWWKGRDLTEADQARIQARWTGEVDRPDGGKDIWQNGAIVRSIEPAPAPAAKPTFPPPERRINPAERKRVADMTPEERAKELLTSPTVDLPNRRAFDEAGPAKYVGMSDADGLKAFNDKFGYEAGDALLRAKAEALKEAGLDAYHEKGDEFLYRGEDQADLTERLNKARAILRERPIQVTMTDGTVKLFKGADFSFGVGNEKSVAESGLKAHKAEREARGERARGELRGIVEVGQEPSGQDRSPAVRDPEQTQRPEPGPEAAPEAVEKSSGRTDLFGRKIFDPIRGKNRTIEGMAGEDLSRVGAAEAWARKEGVKIDEKLADGRFRVGEQWYGVGPEKDGFPVVKMKGKDDFAAIPKAAEFGELTTGREGELFQKKNQAEEAPATNVKDAPVKSPLSGGKKKRDMGPETLATKIRRGGGITKESWVSMGGDLESVMGKDLKARNNIFFDMKGRPGTRHVEDVIAELVRSGDLVEGGKQHPWDQLAEKIGRGDLSVEGAEHEKANDKKYEAYIRELEEQDRIQREKDKSEGIDFEFGFNVADAATKMTAERISDTTLGQGLGTAMKANFGPKVEAEAKETGRTIVERFVDHFRELGGAIAPRMARISEAASNKLARFISSPGAGRDEAVLLIDKVMPGEEGRRFNQSLRAGATFVEMRLRAVREGILRQAATEKDPVKRQQLIDQAKEVQTVVGRPMTEGGDVLANPLMNESDYQASLKDPEVMAVIERFGKYVSPELDAQYRDALGMVPDEAIPNMTQIPGLTMHLRAWRPGDAETPGVIKFSDNRSGQLKNIKVSKYRFARQATGAAEGYHVDMREMIAHNIMVAREAAAKAAMYRQFKEDGIAIPGKDGVIPNPEYTHQLRGAFGPNGLKNLAQSGETSLWFKDEAAMKEARKALDFDWRARQIPGTGALNWATLMSLGEATAHTKNLMTMMLRPGMSFISLSKNAGRVIRQDVATRERLVELAKIGATKPEGFEAMAGQTQSNLNPLKWTGKFLDFVDKSMRLTAEDAFNRISKRDGVAKTEGAKRDFINQLGQYNRRAQNRLVQLARDTGLGPFATAGTQWNINSLRTLFGGHGFKTNSVKADLALRGEMLARMAAFASIVPLANYLINGNVFGDDKTPIGAIKVGEKDGKSQYFDLLGLSGLTRGLRITGVLAVVEGHRAGAKKSGATWGTITDKASMDMINGLAHPFEGPMVGAAKTVITGENTIGMKIAKQVKKGESQIAYNAVAAAIHANPILAAMIDLGMFEWAGIKDPAHKKETTATKQVMKQLGPYGVKESGQSPGKPHQTREIPIK